MAVTLRLTDQHSTTVSGDSQVITPVIREEVEVDGRVTETSDFNTGDH